jgi:hypothetical protein
VSPTFGLILALSDLGTRIIDHNPLMQSNGLDLQVFAVNSKRTHLTPANGMEAPGVPEAFCNFLKIGNRVDQDP